MRLVFCLLVLPVLISGSPQSLVQPKWDWERVIESRNGGPITTTTYVPRTYTTTTLRETGIVELQGTGAGTVEESNIARPVRRQNLADANKGSPALSASFIVVMVSYVVSNYVG